MRLVLPVAAIALAAQTAVAQSAPATLTLDEAVGLARRNNPAYLQTVNARRQADANVRQAYATFLPSVSASLNGRLQKTGTQFFQGVALDNSSDVLTSGYGINLSYTINSDILFGPKVVRADQDAAEATVTSAAELMRQLVADNYLLVLREQALAALQDTLVLTAKGQLELAKARQSVGAATILDVRTAEVALGRSEILALQAHNSAEVRMLRLFEQLGTPKPDSVALTTRFAILPVTFKLDSLLDLAERTNPTLLASKARERSATTMMRGAQGRYLPTLQFSTGWGGQTSALAEDAAAVGSARGDLLGEWRGCMRTDSLRTGAGLPSLNCGSEPIFTSEMEAAVLAENNRFPFDFRKSPRSYSVFISMPIFDNLARETRLQQSVIARDNARHIVRQTELALTSNVTEALRNLQTARRTVELNDVNAAAAREQLSFAEERYRVGAATFLDVTTSRGTFEQAQIDRLNAVYDYHRAFAALENAVGRPLR
jgi:outer membrane protein